MSWDYKFKKRGFRNGRTLQNRVEARTKMGLADVLLVVNADGTSTLSMNGPAEITESTVGQFMTAHSGARLLLEDYLGYRISNQ